MESNFYKSNQRYQALKERLQELGHEDLLMEVIEVIAEAQVDGAKQWFTSVTGEE